MNYFTGSKLFYWDEIISLGVHQCSQVGCSPIVEIFNCQLRALEEVSQYFYCHFDRHICDCHAFSPIFTDFSHYCHFYCHICHCYNINEFSPRLWLLPHLCQYEPLLHVGSANSLYYQFWSALLVHIAT